jgi:predicted RNA-binding Zn-ribbon protein involved in translation (DUF1610 family)
MSDHPALQDDLERMMAFTCPECGGETDWPYEECLPCQETLNGYYGDWDNDH